MSMEPDEEYDWIDDPNLSFDEVVARAERLEPVAALGKPPRFTWMTPSPSTGGSAKSEASATTRRFVGSPKSLREQVS